MKEPVTCFKVFTIDAMFGGNEEHIRRKWQYYRVLHFSEYVEWIPWNWASGIQNTHYWFDFILIGKIGMVWKTIQLYSRLNLCT